MILIPVGSTNCRISLTMCLYVRYFVEEIDTDVRRIHPGIIFPINARAMVDVVFVLGEG